VLFGSQRALVPAGVTRSQNNEARLYQSACAPLVANQLSLYSRWCSHLSTDEVRVFDQRMDLMGFTGFYPGPIQRRTPLGLRFLQRF
jgi:hypothetical protein